MEQKPKQSTVNFIKEIRGKTRRLFFSEQKLVSVMEAQRDLDLKPGPKGYKS
jgi:hypothetical protein